MFQENKHIITGVNGTEKDKCKMENSTINGTWLSPGITEVPFTVYRNYFERQIFAAIYIIVSIVGFVGNIFVILAVMLYHKLRTVTNVFVVSLSVSDFLSCIVLPWQAVAVLGENGWPLPQAHWLCVMCGAVLHVSYGCSINNLALIAVNRWIGITKTRSTARRIFSPRNIAGMIILSWALPTSIILISLVTEFGEQGYEPVFSNCGWIKANKFSRLLARIFSASLYPVQLTVIVLCYASILLYVLKTSRRMTNHDVKSVCGKLSGTDRIKRRKIWKRKIAVTKNLVYIVLAFLICQTPYFVAVTNQEHEWGVRMTMYALAILIANICINPIIYVTSHPCFKEAFGYMIRCKWQDPQNRSFSQRTTSSTSM